MCATQYGVGCWWWLVVVVGWIRGHLARCARVLQSIPRLVFPLCMSARLRACARRECMRALSHSALTAFFPMCAEAYLSVYFLGNLYFYLQGLKLSPLQVRRGSSPLSFSLLRRSVSHRIGLRDRTAPYPYRMPQSYWATLAPLTRVYSCPMGAPHECTGIMCA